LRPGNDPPPPLHVPGETEDPRGVAAMDQTVSVVGDEPASGGAASPLEILEEELLFAGSERDRLSLVDPHDLLLDGVGATRQDARLRGGAIVLMSPDEGGRDVPLREGLEQRIARGIVSQAPDDLDPRAESLQVRGGVRASAG